MKAELSFERDGAQLHRGAGLAALGGTEDAIRDLPANQAGVRLSRRPSLRPLLDRGGAMAAIAEHALGARARPVRALLFDKTEATNWSLGWHQDRTICVRERREVEGFGPWTRKAGLTHVAPPADILAAMVTLRYHLDDVPAANSPLLVAPGSHRLGRVPEAELEMVVQRCGSFACTARAGDIWLYATLILHASEAARSPSRRRVLQVDYAAGDLPGGLEWLGIW